MADARALSSSAEVVPDLAVIRAGELATEEGRDLLGLDGVYCGTDDSEGSMFANELDLDVRLAGEPLGLVSYLLTQWLRPRRKVEQTDAEIAEIARHRLCVADIREGS